MEQKRAVSLGQDADHLKKDVAELQKQVKALKERWISRTRRKMTKGRRYDDEEKGG